PLDEHFSVARLRQCASDNLGHRTLVVWHEMAVRTEQLKRATKPLGDAAWCKDGGYARAGGPPAPSRLHSTPRSCSTYRTGPSLDGRQGHFGGEGAGLYLKRPADLHQRAD